MIWFAQVVDSLVLKIQDIAKLLNSKFSSLSYWQISGICRFSYILLIFFRGEITPLSSSYNISGLVPVCWLLFQCF